MIGHKFNVMVQNDICNPCALGCFMDIISSLYID